MIDLEISLVKSFGWSLSEIDKTDVESLLGFVSRYNDTSGGSANAPGHKQGPEIVYCDTVSWL